ncbi:MAG: hypothetical protein VX405_04745 [Myxococcota bacterium]|nr:hypothetical protein [Myxococcales bacterium]MEC7750798.1 hypothetical protein [Myxococcota bacterium]
MRSVAVLKVAAVLVPGILVRWWLEISGILVEESLMLVDLVVLALTLTVLFLVVDAILRPFDDIRRKVAEAVRSGESRSVLVEGIGLHRELAREVDAIMRLLEERSADANLGPVILRRPDSDSRDFAGSFIEEPLLDEGDPEAMAPRIAPEPSLTMLPRVPEETSATETYREVYLEYVQELRSQDREAEVGSYQEFEAQLEHERERLRSDNPGMDAIFFLAPGPELRPRLVRVNPTKKS